MLRFPACRSRLFKRGLIPLAALALSACTPHSGTPWQGQSVSPDGRWVANARVLMLGINGSQPCARLSLSPASNASQEVLVLSTYEPAGMPISAEPMRLHWVSPLHLDIGLAAGVRVQYQAQRLGNIVLTVHTQAAPCGAAVVINREAARARDAQPQRDVRAVLRWC